MGMLWRRGVVVVFGGLCLFASFLLVTPTQASDDALSDPPTDGGRGVGCVEGVEFECRCGLPRCILKALVSNGDKDCADGSDEGQWDPSLCAIKNVTSEDIRFKRSPGPAVNKGDDATTKWFTGERGRTRPVGLLSTSLGAFVTSGTTTEYLTKVLGSYISGTYARILSTSSKVYHAVPTGLVDDGAPRPTGFIASTTSTEVNGYATTLHTTDYHRTYIDGTYAQLVSSSSNVHYPDWYSTQIDSTGTIDPTRATEGGVFKTRLPSELRGSFRKSEGAALAEVGVALGEDDDPKAVRVNKELKVTGTHGKWVHTGQKRGEDETTYNVFTGSYVQGSKTFLFFFGNTAIDPTRRVAVGHAQDEGKTLTVEGGVPGQPMVVDMNSDNLKVTLSPESLRGKVTRVGGSLTSAGQQQQMEGLLVEIEGSESSSVAIDGANRMGTPVIDSMTVTLPKTSGQVTTSSSSSTSSSSAGREEDENEIPRGRKVPSAEAITLIRPSRTEKVSLPTFTVGHPGEEDDNGERSTTPHAVTFKSSTTSSKSSSSSNSRPVFNKVSGSSERPPQPKSTERIRALGYSNNKGQQSSSRVSSKSSQRGHRAFSGLFDSMNNAVDSDLQSAASTGRATVTYVGFADFTTTVGNTVIVFMPRTKMVEDVNAPAATSSVTPSPSSKTVQPTRFVYQTDEETTTEGKATTPAEEDEEHIQFSVSQATPRKVAGSSKPSTTTPKVTTQRKQQQEEDEETTTVGRVQEEEEVQRPPQIPRPRFRPSSSILQNSKRSSLYSNPRAKFTAASSKAAVVPSSVSATASTVILQKDVLNPTGLVTSVVGTLVGKDGKTTQYTSLVFGTFIGKSYAQVIKSTSKVIAPSATAAPKVPTFIRPTKPTPQPSVTYYDFTTVSSGDDITGAELEETTTSPGSLPPNVDKMEVSVTSTTEKTPSSTSKRPQEDEDEDEYTTTTRGTVELEGSEGIDAEEEETTTPREDENELARRRKVAGSAKDQKIVDDGEDGDETTILVTRTLPTTLFRTYTYYTTFFIPKDDETLTTVASREDTSTFVGHVKKTFTSIVPSASPSGSAVLEVPAVEPSRVRGQGRRREKGQVIFKTVYTTYTYLTTFFSGKTSSVSSREETVSNIVTSTAGGKVTPTSKEVIEPTSATRAFGSSLKSRAYKTATPRLQESPRVSKRPSVSKKVIQEDEEEVKSSEVKYESVTQTLLRTFKTTYTYFTTFFDEDSSAGIKSRTEVITNVVPFVTKTLAPVVTSSDLPATSEASQKPLATSRAFRMSNNQSKRVKETTFYTTYTYLSTIIQGRSTTTKTSKQTSTNVVVGESTVRSGIVGIPIEPTSVVGRKVPSPSTSVRASKALTLQEDNDDNDVEEEGTTVVSPSQHDYYELDGTEGIGITTNRPEGHSDVDINEDVDLAPQGTPVLHTFFTTFTYYTTFYQGGTSSVSSSLETKTQVVTAAASSDVDDDSTAVLEKAPLLSTAEVTATDPVTYFTTYTYWTTSFKDGNSIITSREETVTNVVTPSAAAAPQELKTSTVDNNEIVPTEVELTTFYTTYTYFTTSYVGTSTVVNSRLETVTNVVTGTPVEATQTPRAIGTTRPDEQEVDDDAEEGGKSKSVGRLSTIVASEVGSDRSTTIFSTDVYGTFIDGIYAQVLESTSRVIAPSSTRYIIDPTATPTGVIEVNEGSTVEAADDKTTFFASTTYGSVIDGRYAHVIESSTSVKGGQRSSAGQDDDEQERTGLVRVIKGTLVDNDDLRSTLYTSSILGTFIDGQYAQVIESSSRVIIAPTRSVTSGGRTVDVEGSITERPDEDDEYTTTTEKGQEDEDVVKEEVKVSTEEPVTPKAVGHKLFGKSRAGGSRLSFTGTSKTFTPAITPFASRSRPAAGGFVPRRRSSAITPSKTQDASAEATTTSSRGFSGGRKRFQKPGESSSDSGPSTSTPTPALPSSRTRGSSRFAKPPVGIKPGGGGRSSAVISPTSASGATGSSSPGGRPRGSSSGRFGSSSLGGRVRGGSSSPGGGFVKPSSTRGGAASPSSRFSRGRSTGTSISPSKTSAVAVASVAATQTVASGGEYEDEEYEYESSSPSSGASTTSTTTEAPSTRRIPGGSNRFRLNPKLNLGASTSARPSTSRPTVTRGSPLNLRRFSKPTVASRSTAATSPATEEEEEPAIKGEEYAEEEEEDKPSSSTPATPLRTLPGQRKSLAVRTPTAAATPRPTARGNPGRLTTSSSTAPPTTTKRTYTPRPRPAGFPRAIGGQRTTTTTTTPSPEEYYEDGEFEYQESRHPAANVTLEASASQVQETVVARPEKASLIDSILGSFPFHSLQDDSEDNSGQQPPEDSGHSEERSVRSRRSPQGFHRQVTHDTNNSPYTFTNNHWYGNYGARSARSGGRPAASSFSQRQTNSRSSPSSSADYDYEYVYDDGTPARQPTQPPPPPPTRQSPSARFRGRINPSPSSSSAPSRLRQPFTLTPNNPQQTTSRPRTPSRGQQQSSYTPRTTPRSFIPSRSRSRNPVTSAPPTTTSRSSRFRSQSRYRNNEPATTPSPRSSRFGSSNSVLTRSRGRGLLNADPPKKELDIFEPSSTITVTQFIPAETTIPFVNGKSTEYKTILTPSPSVFPLAPHQFSASEYLGKPVLVLHSEVTATPAPGVTALTRFIIRDSPTTAVTFTPTTIRGRKTSFSHVIPSTAYSLEEVVTTVTNVLNAPTQDNNAQLTNLLLNQLLNGGLLNPAQLLQLQQQGQQQTQVNDPQTPVTQFATKTTSYVTTVTDYTSTIVKITLHGKPLKSTIVETSTHVITATEFITETTVISPTPQIHVVNPTHLNAPQLSPQINPQLIQNLLQQQFAAQLQQQQQLPQIIPTQPALALSIASSATTATSSVSAVVEEKKAEEAKKEEPQSTVITVYVSGKNPGEFSSVVKTVAVGQDEKRRRRSVTPTASSTTLSSSTMTFDTPSLTPTFDDEDSPYFVDYALEDKENEYNVGDVEGNDLGSLVVTLEDSYSYSDPFSNLLTSVGGGGGAESGVPTRQLSHVHSLKV